MKYSRTHKELENIYQPDVEVNSLDLIINTLKEDQRIHNFFKERGISTFDLLSKKIVMFDIFFEKTDFTTFFYNGIFEDLSLDEHVVKYAITINESLTDEECEATNIKYSTVKLYNKPVLYYLHFTLEQLSTLINTELKKRSLL
ncbi:MAG: hypothetical protein BWK73_29840 [Thiothrix lacustris]|jgi:hypothetical protein|uniref:Uncharacterized protein n=1 Tax=Thiothrix lacustris TaxID=525917 RepID=A0A1Y1QJB0_9GAMM|nr:MAG: hypothetical protein BWK73_29840 [Thiothrix lacustris]